VSRWPVAGPSEYWFLASSLASKVKTAIHTQYSNSVSHTYLSRCLSYPLFHLNVNWFTNSSHSQTHGLSHKNTQHGHCISLHILRLNFRIRIGFVKQSSINISFEVQKAKNGNMYWYLCRPSGLGVKKVCCFDVLRAVNFVLLSINFKYCYSQQVNFDVGGSLCSGVSK
jgi:hypothetical protein